MSETLARSSWDPRSETSVVENPAEASPVGVVGSGKLQDWHLTRQAVVYVRQSTPQQVLEHRESTARQYDLVHHAVALGWPADRVVVIDEDQGRSGGNTEGRLGFQRLLAEVSLDHVGIILGIEMSRLARSNKDWHQLLEVCAIFRTLLGDADGLYDPTDYNDRLLLGLKGTMSEAELHILKSRMDQGRWNKARRGELLNHPPIGYVRHPGGDYVLDPDEQAQSVVRLIFDEFERQGSLHGLLRYLVHHDIRLGVRPHFGEQRGELQWRRPNRATLQNMLRNPIYAGAYCYGRREVDPRKKIPGRRSTGRTVKSPDECRVLIPGRHPAYISWDRFESIGRRLDENRARTTSKGAVRRGSSLLSGLLICGRCGRRLLVNYKRGASPLRYSCQRAAIDYGEPSCLSFSGEFLESFVADRLLQVIQPAGLELSLAAATDIQRERGQLHEHWKQRLERVRYQCDRASRQYQTVEPENRLVARELERQWEQVLKQQQQAEEEYARFCREQPASLTEADLALIRSLTHDLPRVWSAESTSAEDRQHIVRLLIEKVIVDIEGQSERVAVTLHWAGGFTSQHQLVRPVERYEQLSYYQELLDRIGELRAQELSLAQMAECLNAEGYRPPKRTSRFTKQMLTRLLSQTTPAGSRPQSMLSPGLLQDHEWWLSDLARELNMPAATLTRWRQVGWVLARKIPVAGGRWAIWADADELYRLRQLRTCPRGWAEEKRFRELTIPKTKTENT